MKTSSLLLLIAALTAATMTGCGHKTAPHPVIDAAATPHDVHRIVYADHRHVVTLRVGDKLALPDDAAFDWRIDFEDKSSFTTVGADAGPATEYQSTRPGLYRMMVFGMPKCLAQEAGCGLSKRRWDVTANVQ